MPTSATGSAAGDRSTWSVERPGPFGPERLRLADSVFGPHRLVLTTATIDAMTDPTAADRPSRSAPPFPRTPTRSPRCSPTRAIPPARATSSSASTASRRPHSRVVVAEHDGALLGFIAVHAMPRFEHDDRIMRILALVVDAGARERGVGRALMAEAERIGDRAGCRVHRDHGRSPSARRRATCTRRWATTRRSPPTCARSSDRADAATRREGTAAGFPRLRLRDGAAELLDLPWERPLGSWSARRRSTACISASCPSGPRATSSGSWSRTAHLRPQGGAARRSPPPSSTSSATSRRSACRRSSRSAWPRRPTATARSS